MHDLPAIELGKDLRRSIRRGHPWIFNRAVAGEVRALAAGQLVRVVYRGRDVAVGFVDPRGAIAVRILEVIEAGRGAGRGASQDDGGPRVGSEPWVRARVAAAVACRQAAGLFAVTDAVRLIHGENDFLPGLVVDLYGDTAVVVCDGVAAAAFWQPRLSAVLDGLDRTGLAVSRMWARAVDGRSGGRSGGRKGSRRGSRGEGHGGGRGAGVAIRGEPPGRAIVIAEHGARLASDVRQGQKTGLFLDQRGNRRRVRDLAEGAEVLNLFAYTGGFSVQAALGGARRVTSVDRAAPAMAAARDNFELSGIDPAPHRFAAADCFEFLANDDRQYELVIVDPPSFASSQRARERALGAYRQLNTLALAAVARGGWLLSASCSSHVTTGDLLEVLGQAGQASRRAVQVVEIRGTEPDHPIRPGFPEGDYLSAVLLRVG
ncbi:MAG: class I SAM-dependent rRNA methyltransferase [Myxococcota bacterium]